MLAGRPLSTLAKVCPVAIRANISANYIAIDERYFKLSRLKVKLIAWKIDRWVGVWGNPYRHAKQISRIRPVRQLSLKEVP